MDMEKENISKTKNVDDRIRLISLPLTKEDLTQYLGKFDQFQFIVDYKKSFDNLKSNTKFLRYLSNCGIVGAYLNNFKLDENLENLLLEYVKFDQEVVIPALSEIWISIVDLHPGDNQFFDHKLKEFIDKFRVDHKDYVDEINTFFFSLSQALNNIIVPTDKELEEKIVNAPKNKLKLCNINVVSLVIATTFYPYITKIKDCKLYMYEEFISNVLNGMSVTRAFLTRDTPYRMMYLYNQFCLNPEETKEKMQAMLDKFNKEREKD